MTIKLHIERLVLDGLPIARRHGPCVQAAIEAELGRSLAGRALAVDGGSGPGAAAGRANTIHLPVTGDPALVGTRIAQAIRRSLGKLP